jgi:1-acyl-sn-glycerol-3-phosphate acyltransferase
MEFVLALTVAAIVAGLAWWRSGQRAKETVFFGVVRFYVQFWHRWWKRGSKALPVTGPVLVISNHTCSADPTFLQSACNTRVLSWLAAREHYHGHPLIRKLLDTLHCVPVERTGRDAGALRAALRRLGEGRVLCLFPEGNLSGVGKGRLRVPKHGAAWLALKSQAAVVPAYIAGGPQTHHLVSSWVCPSHKPVRVHLGSPIDLAGYRQRPFSRQLVEEVAHHLMVQVLALAPRSKGGRIEEWHSANGVFG